MPDTRPSSQIAAPSIRPYVQPLWPGALVPPFETRDEEGRKLNLADDHVSGHPLVLLFMGDPESAEAADALNAIAAAEARIDAADAVVIAVSASSNALENRQRKQTAGFRWPISGDPSGAFFASFGLHLGTDTRTRMLLITPYRQIRAFFDLGPESGASVTLETIMTLIENSQMSEETRWAPPHAPILVVPNVLSAEECAGLVQSVETDTPFMVRQPQPGEIAGNYKIPVYDQFRQDRVDLIIKDQNTLRFLDERIFGRVTPMIKKSFAFDVTRREDLHIARYVGAREGIAIGHRDNTDAPGAHRRFALSISLNEEYEGGEITFSEFSPKGYRVPAGSAMVFSSSLLHEVQETTSGVRYNLISHFFNESTMRR